MNIHKNARLTPIGREWIVRLVESGRTPQAAGVCPRTVRKWLARFRAEGVAGLQDRSSRPKRLYRATAEATVAQVIAWRSERFTGDHIARAAGFSPATVSRILKRASLSRIKDIDPPAPARRYQCERPGELIHIDIKKLHRFREPGHRVTGDRGGGRSVGAGWEFVHVCGDASRIAFTRIMALRKPAAPRSSSRPPWPVYRGLGVIVARVMTDNGS